MNVAPVSSTLALAGQVEGPENRNAPVTAEQVKKVAAQFEAILVRQLLKPAIEPMMNGGLGDAGSSGSVGGSGGGIYGFMLTDVLSTSLSQGGELGFAKLIEKQLMPAALKAQAEQEADANAARLLSEP